MRLADILGGSVTWVALAGCGTPSTVGGGVNVNRFQAEARAEAEVRDESFTSATSISTREMIFRENIKFTLDGNVYHPKLVTFGGVLDLGLEQREQTQQGGATEISARDDNNRYDLNVALVKDHPYSVRLFAQRTQERVRQTFFPTNDAVVSRNGAQIMAKEWPVPSQVEVSRYDFEGEWGDLRRERRDTLNVTGSRNSEGLDVHYTLFAQDVDSDIAGGRYDDLQVLAGATWRFGQQRANSISIEGQQREQTGDTENENAALSGRTRFLLADDIENRSGLAVSRSTFQGVRANETNRLDAFTEFEHRLYDSLTTTLRGDLLEQDIGQGGDLRRVGGSGRASYRKRVPFGRLRLEYRCGRARQEETGQFGANVTVNAEPHVVEFGSAVFLDNPNVDAANLLVTDSSGATVYATPGDYSAERIGVATRLVFPPGSRITPGQTILVTYTFASSFDRTFDTDTQLAAAELLFGEFLGVETRWSELDQSLVSGISDSTLDHATEIAVAVRLRGFEQNLSAEYLDHDSVLAPFARTTLSWYTWTQLDDRLALGCNASAYEIRFEDGLGKERGVSGMLNLTWQPTDRLSLEARTEIRRSDLRVEDGWGLFHYGRLRYGFRRSSIDLSWMTSNEEWDVTGDRDVMRALLTMTRRF